MGYTSTVEDPTSAVLGLDIPSLNKGLGAATASPRWVRPYITFRTTSSSANQTWIAGKSHSMEVLVGKPLN